MRAKASAIWLRFEFSTHTNKMRFTPLVIFAKCGKTFNNSTACSISGKETHRARGRAHWETRRAAPDAPSDFPQRVADNDKQEICDRDYQSHGKTDRSFAAVRGHAQRHADQRKSHA